MKFDCVKVTGKVDYVRSVTPMNGGYKADVSINGSVIPKLQMTTKLYEELEAGEDVTLYGIFKNEKDKEKNTGVLYGLANQGGNKFFATSMRFSVPLVILITAVIAAAIVFVAGWCASLFLVAWLFGKEFDGLYTLTTNLAIAEAALVGGFFVWRAWLMLKSTSNPEAWANMDAATLSSRFSKFYK